MAPFGLFWSPTSKMVIKTATVCLRLGGAPMASSIDHGLGYRAILGCFWSCWLTHHFNQFGHFGNFRQLLGHFWRCWSFLRALVAIFSQIIATFRCLSQPFRMLSHVLHYHQPFWVFFNLFGGAPSDCCLPITNVCRLENFCFD